MQYRADIDGLRAVAVSSVVLCHAEFGVPGGYIGVDVFFVISGYLITSLIWRDLQRGTFSFADFWERRVRRIAPALVVMTAAVLGAGWFLLTPDAYESLGKSVTALVLLCSNVLFWRETFYFADASAMKPLLHTWSLAVEEQFYLLLPVTLWGIARGGRMRAAFPLFVLVAIVSFALSCVGAYSRPGATFYLLPTRAWELLAGALPVIAPKLSWSFSTRSRNLASTAGLLMILVPCAFYDAKTPFPGLTALPPVLGTVLIIVAGEGAATLPRVNRWLSLRPFVFIGLISYSLYLWHWPLLAFAADRWMGTPPASVRAALVATAFIVGTLSWKYVETPLRARRLLATRAPLLKGFATVSLLLIAAAATVWKSEGFISRLPPRAEIFSRTGARDQFVIHDLQLQDVPRNLVALGVPGDRPELLVWGDSHAMAVLPAIDAVCKAHGVTAAGATKNSTAPMLDFYFAPELTDERDAAIAFNRAVVEYVAAEKIKHVLLVGRWHVHFGRSGPESRSQTGDDGNPLAAPALLRTVEALRASGSQVYFLIDNPSFDYVVPDRLVHLAWRNLPLESVEMSPEEYQLQFNVYRRVLPDLQARGVTLLDPLPTLRERTKSVGIRPFEPAGSFYCDEHHLSFYGATVIQSTFKPLADAITAARTPTASNAADRAKQ